MCPLTGGGANLTTLESRLSAARALLLDNLNNLNALLSTLRATEFGKLDATVSSRLASAAYAAEKGTNNALLAANYLGHQFTPYSYINTLAANASFAPPNKTIVMLAWMNDTIAAGDFIIIISADVVKIVASVTAASGMTEGGFIGCVYFDGTYPAYRNASETANSIILNGVTMA